MYPVPPTEERFGNTERIVGSWFASRKQRQGDTGHQDRRA
jgi:hypothetical protein